MIIKHGIPEVFKGIVSDDITSAKEFLAKIEKRFAKSDKAETSTLLHNLISMKYQCKGKGCLSYRKPIDPERWIYVGDGKSVEVEAIGHLLLLLCTGFI